MNEKEQIPLAEDLSSRTSENANFNLLSLQSRFSKRFLLILPSLSISSPSRQSTEAVERLESFCQALLYLTRISGKVNLVTDLRHEKERF